MPSDDNGAEIGANGARSNKRAACLKRWLT